MPTLSGHVYYDNSNLYTPGTGIANVPVALFNPAGLTGAVALTDAAGSFSFINVPNGNYQLIEAWGTGGGIATPVNFATSAVPTPVAPVEAEPLLSALSIVPPALADRLQALTPNLVNITVSGADINQNFFDGPVGNKPLILTGVTMVGSNLITAASNGTWGSNPPDTLGNTRPAVNPYPGVIPGFAYTTALYPSDGQFTVTNTSIGWVGPPWWITSDHTTSLETGRFQMVNGAKPGDVVTYTLTLNNSGNVPANNVVITDAIPAGTTFVGGSVTGATGTPPTLTLTNPIPVGGGATVTFQVLVGNAFPVPNPIPNSAAAAFTFTTDPSQPNGRTGTSDSNSVTTQINSAVVSAVKTADPAFANVGDTVSYTITLTNSGNVVANNVVLTDVIPPGTAFVPGSLAGATGTPPTLTLANPVPAGGTVSVTFDVIIGSSIPNPNPLENSVAAAFTYTVNPAEPNGVSGTALGGPAATQVNSAKLVMTKSADKPIAYIGDIITYQIAVKNNGNVAANNVVLTDLLPGGVSLVAGSLIVSVPYSGTLDAGLALTNPVAPGQTVTLSFKVKVDVMPNPVANKVTAVYAYTVNPAVPNGVTAAAGSNVVNTLVFRYNFGQQISDLIESVALEQASLAAIANAEGAKIQKMVAMDGVTTQELLCLNKSVADMMDSIAMLEAVLKQKLGVVNCQINGSCM